MCKKRDACNRKVSSTTSVGNSLITTSSYLTVYDVLTWPRKTSAYEKWVRLSRGHKIHTVFL